MNLRPRLIPSVILAATVLLGLKVSDIFAVGSHAQAAATSAAQATSAPIDLTSLANAAKLPSISPTAGSAENNNAAKPATPNAPPQQAAVLQQQQAAAPKAPAQQASAPAAGGGKPMQVAEASPADKTGAPNGDKAGADKAAGDKPVGHAPMKDPLLLSPAEIEVLQQLSARRTQIDQRASELDQQQVVLQATEKRIDDKIAKLEALQKSIQVTVDKENAADDARTQSLVKIYETMKPADAAQILSQLDMPILLQMLSHMKEAKTAPILAAMDPTKAQAITTAMAQRQNPLPAAPAAIPAKP